MSEETLNETAHEDDEERRRIFDELVARQNAPREEPVEEEEPAAAPMLMMMPLTSAPAGNAVATPIITHDVEVDFAMARVSPAARIVQYAQGVDCIAVHLYKDGQPYSASELYDEFGEDFSAQLEFTRGDGVSVILQYDHFDDAKQIVYFVMTAAATQIWGMYRAAIGIGQLGEYYTYAAFIDIEVLRNPIQQYTPPTPPPTADYVKSFNGQTGDVVANYVPKSTTGHVIYGTGAQGVNREYPVAMSVASTDTKNHTVVSLGYFEAHQSTTGLYAHHFQCIDGSGGPSVYFVLFSSHSGSVEQWDDLVDMLHLNGCVQFREDPPLGTVIGTLYLDSDNTSIDYFGHHYGHSSAPEHVSGFWSSTTLAIFDDVVEAM